MDFNSLGLHEQLLEGIHSMNFKQPTPIQQQAIPLILQGKDVVGIAQTGTGKTAAFVLPLLNKIIDLQHEQSIKALIIVPTRELALQIDQAIEAYSYFTGVSSVAIYGGGDGNDFYREKQAIVSGVDIVIATPGRLITHMHVGHVDFSKLHFLVLDEADRMLDMGFQPDLQRIISKCNDNRQSLMFSATMPKQILQLAHNLLKNPETISIALSKPAEGVTQKAYVVFDDQKLPLIKELLKDRKGQSIIVFGSTRQSVARLHQQLKHIGLNVGAISSDLMQDEREKVLLSFRTRQTDVLVATDVVSRGIDIDGINMVINFDVPGDAEDYVHRIGRTARADKKGEAITLVAPSEQGKFKRIETLIGREVEKALVPESLGPVPPYDPKSNSGGGHYRGNKPNHHSGNNRPKNSGNKKPFHSRPKGPKPPQ